MIPRQKYQTPKIQTIRVTDRNYGYKLKGRLKKRNNDLSYEVKKGDMVSMD